jgi:hypothetical protein
MVWWAFVSSRRRTVVPSADNSDATSHVEGLTLKLQVLVGPIPTVICGIPGSGLTSLTFNREDPTVN